MTFLTQEAHMRHCSHESLSDCYCLTNKILKRLFAGHNLRLKQNTCLFTVSQPTLFLPPPLKFLSYLSSKIWIRSYIILLKVFWKIQIILALNSKSLAFIFWHVQGKSEQIPYWKVEIYKHHLFSLVCLTYQNLILQICLQRGEDSVIRWLFYK
jgi:hypothetical protein